MTIDMIETEMILYDGFYIYGKKLKSCKFSY